MHCLIAYIKFLSYIMKYNHINLKKKFDNEI